MYLDESSAVVYSCGKKQEDGTCNEDYFTRVLFHRNRRPEANQVARFGAILTGLCVQPNQMAYMIRNGNIICLTYFCYLYLADRFTTIIILTIRSLIIGILRTDLHTDKFNLILHVAVKFNLLSD